RYIYFYKYNQKYYKFCRPRRVASLPANGRRCDRGLPASSGRAGAHVCRCSSFSPFVLVEEEHASFGAAERRIPGPGRCRAGNSRARLKRQYTTRRLLASRLWREDAGSGQSLRDATDNRAAEEWAETTRTLA